MIRSFTVIVCIAALAGAVSACGGDEGVGDGGREAASDVSSDASPNYEVFLANALSDTLRGAANFGRVLDSRTGDELFVIRLSTGFDFAGGVVISRRDTVPPEPGTYDLSAPTDSLATVPVNKFLIIYREGMLRDLRSTAGTLTFSVVTDTLIEGRFDATLQGVIAERGRDLAKGEVHAVGHFRAAHGMPGYVIGL